tara:strand:- start:203 stop:769 length:567 start_codon:yes stop_codon:yes gene_type:complete
MTSRTKNIIFIVSAVAVVLGISAFILHRRKKVNNHVVFMGGLDYRSGDLKIDAQTELLKKGVGEKFTIDPYTYKDIDGVLSALEELQKAPYVVLFSAGGSKTKSVAEKLKAKGFDLSKLYVVEPYTKSSNTKASVQSAISLGMPEKNLIVGKSSSTGKGVTNNATSTPSCSPSHWCSITEVGKIISNQ